MHFSIHIKNGVVNKNTRKQQEIIPTTFFTKKNHRNSYCWQELKPNDGSCNKFCAIVIPVLLGGRQRFRNNILLSDPELCTWSRTKFPNETLNAEQQV
jgi:hypothetical protein